MFECTMAICRAKKKCLIASKEGQPCIWVTMVVNLRYLNDSDTSLYDRKLLWEKLTGNAKKALKNSTNPSSSDRNVSWKAMSLC